MYGASSNSYRNLMPNHALQWAAIRWARERGCTVYDFWGIPPEIPPDEESTKDTKHAKEEETVNSEDSQSSILNPHPSGLWGVYRFKQGFGGRNVHYAGAFDYIYNYPVYWAGTTLLPRLRALMQRA